MGMKLTNTERAIIAQLTECTGAALCDSGGAYGRNWQRNQGRKFIGEPATVLDFSNGSIEVSHNVFHFLNDRLEYDGDMTRRLKAFARRKAYEDSYWPEIMEAFMIAQGADEEDVHVTNTYNGDDLVSQTLQYCEWYEYFALQVHGGCDVRGGYTTPKVYRGDYGALNDNSRAMIACPVCRAMWDSDDGYYWSPDGDSIDLSSLDAQDTGLTLPLDVGERLPWPLLNLSEQAYCGKREAYKLVDLGTENFPAEKVRGNFYVNSKGEGLCPYCLTGTLYAR